MYKDGDLSEGLGEQIENQVYFTYYFEVPPYND